MKEHCYAEISLSRFKTNVIRAKTYLAGKARLMVAVKSNAYGHGGAQLARAALEAGADGLAVLDIPTGLKLRSVSETTPLLCWLHSPQSDFGEAARVDLDIGVSAIWQLAEIEKQAPKKEVKVHLKIDTGLHRNGALAEDWPALVERAKKMESNGHIRVVGIWSHLSDTSIEENKISLERFQAAVEAAKEQGVEAEIHHVAASMAALEQPDSRLDMVRVGIIAYGVSPLTDRRAEELGFLPVMSVRAEVLECRRKEGEALIGMGFADGLLPPASGQGWIRHKSAKFSIKSVDADQLTIGTADSENLPSEGEFVTLWGDPEEDCPRAEDWARWAGTIGDEVVTSVADRVPRHFIE